MCSIAGFYNSNRIFNTEHERYSYILNDMNKALAHRGPDAQNTVLSSHCGMAHTRLSIRDVARGEQPMKKVIGENTIYIVYNGEIYNTKELKSELLALGYTFDTTSDTEVILNCFLHFGPDFVHRLNGIFAFAIYDEHIQTIYLYRDHFGVKPLYYSVTDDGTLVFASEIKGLLYYPGIRPVIDARGLCEVFGIGPSKTPGCGVFQNIDEVKPGHFMKFSPYGMTDFTYYRITSNPHTDSYEDTVEKVRYLVKDSIERQIVSDVPVCTFLSGGIDSSIVSSVCAAKLREQGKKLHTFSFDFKDNSKYFKSNAFQPEQDRPYVDMMVAHIGSDHTYLTCNYSDLADYLYTSVESRDMPTMADVDSSLLYFCSLVAKEYKVVLTGECADEIFGGYPWFYREELLNVDGFPWSADLSARTALLSDEAIRTLDLEDYVRERYRDTLAQVPTLPGEPAEDRRRREMSYLNLRWFMQTLLDRMDRASMAWGLEARVPFADHRIVEYVYNVPWSMKYRDGMEKRLLRDACKDLLPPQMLYRKKSPYPKTYSPVYENLLAERFRRMLSDPKAPVHRFLDKRKAERFLEQPKDYGRPWFGQLMAGPQMIAYFLQINYWMERCGIG